MSVYQVGETWSYGRYENNVVNNEMSRYCDFNCCSRQVSDRGLSPFVSGPRQNCRALLVMRQTAIAGVKAIEQQTQTGLNRK